MKASYWVGAALLSVSAAAATGPEPSPYVDEASREIKSLSPELIADYLAGRGMGLAKAAELNGYAGPLHVLDLAERLQLSPKQRTQTEALFSSMQSKAQALGRELVERERGLDRLFVTRAATPASLQSTLAEIGSLQTRLRSVHLEAHLAQVQILSPEQNAEYARLRGYDQPGAHTEHHGH